MRFYSLSSMTVLVLTLAIAVRASDSGESGTTVPPTLSEAASQPAGPIQDNSFLVEEAYNQEDGVIQHISFVQPLSTGDWVYTQTDEWPMGSLKHQLSLTMSVNRSGIYASSGPGWGDTSLNYRYQLAGSGEARLAVAPRISLLVPTGDSTLGRGSGGWGLQTNLPISIQHNAHLVTHWNAGLTWVPAAQNPRHEHAAVLNPSVGQSTVWLVKPRFNALCEIVWTSNAAVSARGRTERSSSLYVSPGIRWAYNFRNGLQVVPGIALPFGIGEIAGQHGPIFYLSLEHPFRPAHSRR